MDKDTPSKVQKALTQAIRQLLEHVYAEQLEGPSTRFARTGPSPRQAEAHLDADQRLVRAKLVAALCGHRRGQRRYRLSRWSRPGCARRRSRPSIACVALKMLEARGLLQECAFQGRPVWTASRSSRPGAWPRWRLPDRGYRLCIECILVEIGREVEVLFDRLDPGESALATPDGPGRSARPPDQGLAGIWGEDETIGWVYQYFNGEDERKKMREESQAPRNSRELALRNQFFTPRYVVPFLTDSTLGRMCCDMHRGACRS